MKGMELSEAFYRECGEPMLREQFPEVLGKIAVGLTGSGSEVLGFDDEISEDHDFAPGFCIFLPGEETVDRRTAFLLERAYAKLPREFRGYTRPHLSPVGGDRVGVLRMADFFAEKVGSPDGILSEEAWLRIPSFYLLEAVNGKVFYDGSGEFTKIRERLRLMPPDSVKKRLAGQLLLMGQAGHYNYERCVKHSEKGAAQLSLAEYVRACLSASFLIAGVYEPYYKWGFRALREWKDFSEVFSDPRELAGAMETLISSPNETEEEISEKKLLIGKVSMNIGRAAVRAGLLAGPLPASAEGRDGEGAAVRGSRGAVLSGRILSENPERLSFTKGGAFREEAGTPVFDPERAAYEVNDSIEDAGIRELNILYCAGV